MSHCKIAYSDYGDFYRVKNDISLAILLELARICELNAIGGHRGGEGRGTPPTLKFWIPPPP